MQGESNSISNQKRILETYAKQNGFTNLRWYTDDGFFPARTSSGPDFKPMLADLEAGKVGNGHRQGHEPVRAKLLAGRVLHGKCCSLKRVCVFIAVNDNVDSASEGMDNDFTPAAKSVQ